MNRREFEERLAGLAGQCERSPEALVGLGAVVLYHLAGVVAMVDEPTMREIARDAMERSRATLARLTERN